MSAITSLDDLTNLMTGGGSAVPQFPYYWKDSRISGATASATVAGRLTSLWQYDGVPSAGAVPTTVSVPTNSTMGSLKQNNPGGSRQLWLGGVTCAPLNAGTLIVYDRLLHIGGLNATTITSQIVGGAITRYTGGTGNQIWAEIYTAIGATLTTITASYTDQNGVASTGTSTSFGGTGLREAQRLIPLNLSGGDTGVRNVSSVKVLASTTTAGNFGITIAHPLAFIPCSLAGSGVVMDFISGLPGLVEVLPNACLAFAWLPNGTTAPSNFGGLSLIEK